MLITIDCGNSSIKVALVNHDGIVTEWESHPYSRELNSPILKKNAHYLPVIYSDVRGHAPTISLIEDHYRARKISWLWKYPFELDYRTPETLGTDRLAALAGASTLFPKKPVLVIDAGTCITYDFINEANTYIGGAISPGIEMRLNAMHHYTGKLPKITQLPEKKVIAIGKSTTDCMLSAAIQGTLFEICGYVNTLGESVEINIVLTGGSAQYLADNLECNTFVAPNLNHTGLHKIYQLNAGSYFE